MAIEPLGSMMTIQSQTVRKVPENKTAVENKEVSTPEQMTNVDAQTAKVANIVESDKSGADPDTREQNNEKIKKAVEQLNKSMPHSEAIFGIHDDTNRVTIKIVDRSTKEVIKEFPPEETLDMIAKVWELAGILVDEKR